MLPCPRGCLRRWLDIPGIQPNYLSTESGPLLDSTDVRYRLLETFLNIKLIIYGPYNMDNMVFATVILYILYDIILVGQIFLNRLKFRCCKLFPYLVPFEFFNQPAA